jgi:hypothetical protein
MLVQKLIEIADKVKFGLDLTETEQKEWDNLSADKQQEYLRHITIQEYS